MIGDRICKDFIGYRPGADLTTLDMAFGNAMASAKAVRQHIRRLHDDPGLIEAVEQTFSGK